MLKHGTIFKIDVPMGWTRYHIRGRSADGASIVCPVEVDEEEDRLVIVTVFRDRV